MEYSTMSQSSLFANFSFASNSTMGPGSSSTPDKNKEKRFYDWHQKQGITAPQDYPVYASQPAPFASIPQHPNYPTAASPYLQKVMTHQQVETNNRLEVDDIFGSDIPERRKPTLKKTTSSSSPPTPAGQWPKSMFGSRPPTRTRSRTSSTPDINLGHDASESNLPPLASIYDDLPFDPVSTESKSSEPTMTPTQVRVSNFSEERFSDLIRSLRRYYGPILESYSGLPESESKFSDPEIIPREKLDSNTARMVQPQTGSEGGPGPWVRITFRDREAAERAIAGATKNELVIGGRTIFITLWDSDPIITDQGLPFQMMDIDTSTPGASGHNRRRSRSNIDAPVPAPTTDPSVNGLFSEHMPGAKLAVPQQVAFEKQEGWFSSVTNALVSNGATGGATSVLPVGERGRVSGVSEVYNYFMNDVIGFKYL